MSRPPLQRNARITLPPARQAELLAQDWYYVAELAPNVWTPGRGHPNIIVTRELLRRADIAGARCLDIGTDEGLVPILLAHRGAAEVFAVDVRDKSEKIAALKDIHGVDFVYCPHLSLDRTAEALDHQRHLARPEASDGHARPGFDLVVMSGLLYHVYSPLQAIGLARSLLKANGLLVLETAASTDDGFAMRWNFDGARWLYPNPTNTWFPTLKLLDHHLRMLSLSPIDCVHLPPYDGLVRVAIACRAVEEAAVCLGEGETMRAQATNVDFNRLFDRAWVKDAPSSVAYAAAPAVVHADSGTCDIFASVAAQPPLPLDATRARLGLNDRD